jgi:hypothetical protein
MNMNSAVGKELLQLLSTVCDGGSDAAAYQRIEELLREHSSAGEIVVAFSRLHADLCHVESETSADHLVSLALEREFAIDQSARNVGTPEFVESRINHSYLKHVWPWRGLVAVAAAVLAIAGVGSQIWQESESDVPVKAITLVRLPNRIAELGQLDRSAWAPGQSFVEGDILSEGTILKLLEGRAHVSMSCGADIVLEGPCRVVLEADDFIRLEQGRLTAEVASWGQGFAVITPAVRATNLGTRFAAVADPSGTSEVHALDGEVLVQPNHSDVQRFPLKLKTGEALRVNIQRDGIEQFPAETMRFVGRAGAFLPLRPLDLANTGFGLAIGEVDAHWRVAKLTDGGRLEFSPAIVGRADSIYLDNAPHKSQWISVVDGTTKGVPANSTYTFATHFDLTGYDLSEVVLTGQVLVDNAVDEIRLNGKPVPIESWAIDDPNSSFQAFHPIEIREGFLPHKNFLEFDVRNTTFIYDTERTKIRPDIDNPMAIRVEWQAFGRMLQRPPDDGPSI